jgi:hypothetical protein
MGNVPRKPALILLGAVAIASAISDYRSAGRPEARLLVGAQVPQNVRLALERACRDCHSDATHYPWYSYVAPVSWLINRDVQQGRERLNLSKWSDYPVVRRERCLSDIANQVESGGMPLAIYTFVHRNARLSKAEVDAIFEWTQAERLRLILERAGSANSR